ncbi:MAG: PEP-CTERM sorting domain-containing protein [Kiritimatiellae bacterium]|nr:PEP-CTERM sorting domain-containing protein [Kiritimatiellia bacterium]
MKKFATFLFALLCASSMASTVDWALTGKSFTTSDGSAERASGYYVTVFLYSDFSKVNTALQSLGTAATSSISTIETYVKSTGTTKATGAASGSFTSSEPSVTPVSIFMVAFDAATIAEAKNYIVSSEVVSDAYTKPDVATNKGEFKASSFGNWTPVPEPSTAALALAGLALLLKRRKA